LSSDFTKFEDLLSIFPQSYVDLLEAEYDSVKDIDLIIGGSLESFQKLEEHLVGETFSCIIRDQFRRAMAGDVYFFTNLGSPHPFSSAQIDTIRKFSLNHLVCTNTGVDQVPSSSYYSDSPRVPCSEFEPIDLDVFAEL
jgi:peroxidase